MRSTRKLVRGLAVTAALGVALEELTTQMAGGQELQELQHELKR